MHFAPTCTVVISLIAVAFPPVARGAREAPRLLLQADDLSAPQPTMVNATPRGDVPENCAWENGSPDYNVETDVTPGTQQASDYPFFAQVADDFILTCADTCTGDANGDGFVDPLDSGYVRSRFGDVVDGSNPLDGSGDLNHDCVVDALDDGVVFSQFGTCKEPSTGQQVYVTQIIFHTKEYNPECGNPSDWTGVRVVVYNDADGIPDGEPEDDGTISGGPPVVDVQIAPVAYTWIEVEPNRFQVTLDVDFLLEKNVPYWLAISPQQTFVPFGQVGWNSTLEGNGVSALQHFAAAGVTQWTIPGGGADMAFTLIGRNADRATTGACCSGDLCEEGVDVLFCQDPYSRFTTCSGGCDVFSPPCGTGACCIDGGGCVEATQEECTGSFQGAGTTCASVECPQPPPVNDDCTAPIQVFDGDNAYSTHGATTDGPQDGAEGPCADEFVGSSDAWYTYEATCTGRLEVSLCKVCDGDTTLQIYRGNLCDPLGLQVACGDDTCGIGAGPSVATVCEAITGRNYLIRVGAWNDGTLPETPTTDGIMTITCSTEEQDCCETSDCPGCADDAVEACVCAIDSFCCEVEWDKACVASIELFGCGECP